jgi:hypothetical protein
MIQDEATPAHVNDLVAREARVARPTQHRPLR